MFIEDFGELITTWKSEAKDYRAKGIFGGMVLAAVLAWQRQAGTSHDAGYIWRVAAGCWVRV